MMFSVIIPVYNKADTIRSAVESVYAQTIKNYEIIVVDDGSRDALEEALCDLHGPRLRLIRQENSGVSVARNTGIAHATGTHVCFLDGDDLWKPDHLETLGYLIKKYPTSRTFVTSHEIILQEGKIIHSSASLIDYDEDMETTDLLGLLNCTSYSVIHTNSVCVDRSLLEEEKIYFEPGIKIGEDTDVWYRLGLKYPVAVSKRETTMYRREYSTASRESFHVHDWMFSRRAETLLADEQISETVKASIVDLVDRYKMTSSREYMAAGNRMDAKKVLSEVKIKKGKRYMLTKIFTWIPCGLCKKLLGK